MNKYRIFAVVNTRGETVAGSFLDSVAKALQLYSALIFAKSKARVDVEWIIRKVNEPFAWVFSPPYWGLDFTCTNRWNSDAIGFHEIAYFYVPDGQHAPNEIASWTYLLDGRPQRQIRMDTIVNGMPDPESIKSLLDHEGRHVFFRNLWARGTQIQDTTDQGDPTQGDDEYAALEPYWDIICKPLPTDTYIGSLLAQIAALKDKIASLLSSMSPYQTFKKKWLGKPIDFDGSFGRQCMDVYRQYCKDLGVPQSPPVQGAKDVWGTYLPTYFLRIEYQQGFVPKQGDIVVWGFAPNGHISIFDNGNVSAFQCIGQNWQEPVDGKGVVKIENHQTYSGVLGVLRKMS